MKALYDMDSLAKADVTSDEKFILCGDLVSISLDDHIGDFDEMRRQQSRLGNFKLTGAGLPIYTYVDAQAIALAEESSKAKFGLALDLYLAYLRRQKRDVVLLGGAESESGTFLDIILVKNGRISCVSNKLLPLVSSVNFSVELRIALEDVKHRVGSEALPRIVVAYPLPPIEDYHFGDMEYLGQEVFSKTRLTEIDAKQRSALPISLVGIPLLMMMAGLLLGGGFVYYEWNRYNQLQNDFKSEIRGLEAAYTEGAAKLDLLSKQQMYLDSEPSHKLLLDQWKNLAGAVSKINGVIVKRVAVYDKSRNKEGLGGRIVDFEMDIDVPANLSISERVQAKEVLTELANLTGYELWLREENFASDAGQNSRRLMIEGASSGI